MSWILLSTTVCVCCAQHALKCMIMLTQTLTSIILKHQPANNYILLISNTNYTFYISLCSSFSALLNKQEIFFVRWCHSHMQLCVLVVILISFFSINLTRNL